MAAAPVARLSTDEYLAHERQAEFKSEYIDGYVVGMAGGSPEHSLITMNAAHVLVGSLKGKACRVYGSDLKVSVSHKDIFYPDLMVICGPLRYAEPRKDAVTNPTVVIEVLSPSTETRDRGIKSAAYRKLDSLQEYILIDQSAAHIEHYVRTPENAWLLTDIDGLDAQLRIAAIDCTIPLSEIYDKVEFPAA